MYNSRFKMNRIFLMHVIAISSILFATIFSSNLHAVNGSNTDRGKTIESQDYNSKSAIQLIKNEYSNLIPSDSSEESRKKLLRLAMALKVYDRAYSHIHSSYGNNDSNNKKYLPSSEAISKIEKTLDKMASQGALTDTQYVQDMNSKLNNIGSVEENEIIGNILEDLQNNKDISNISSPPSLPELINPNNNSEDNDQSDDSEKFTLSFTKLCKEFGESSKDSIIMPSKTFSIQI